MAAAGGILLNTAKAATRGVVAGARGASWMGGRFALDTFNAAIQGGDYPHTRELHYQANNASANLIPDLASLAKVWIAGRIPDNVYQQMLAYHGVDWNPAIIGQGLTFTERSWNEIVDLSVTRHSLEEYLTWHRQGRYDYADLLRRLRDQGFKDQKDQELFLKQWTMLDPQQILSLYFTGWIEFDNARDLLIEHGYKQEDAARLLRSLEYGLSLADLVTLKNRGKIGDVDYLNGLSAIGFRTEDARKWAHEFERTYPTVSDLILFSVREVWKPDVVERYGYDLEYPREFGYWAAKQGLDWGEAFDPGDGQQRPELKWPLAHWRSHWHLMSPTQAYEALHRIRGEDGNPATWRVPGVRPFTRDDLKRMLAVNDYAPGVREWLEALSYRVMRLVDIRKLTRLGLRNRAWAVEQYMDRGHTRTDAETIADLADEERKREENPYLYQFRKNRSRLAFTRARKAYKSGYLGRPVFLQVMQNGGLTFDEAEREANAVEFELQTETVEQVRNAVRRDFMTGLSDAATAQARLVKIGMSVYHAENYLIRWRAERGEVRKQASTRQILDWLTAGQITQEEAYRRLTNLGWSNVDILLHLDSARRKILGEEVKMATAQQKRQEKAAKQVERVVREQEAALRRSQSQMRALMPMATLKSLLRNSRISEAMFRNYAAASGHTMDVIDLHLREVSNGGASGASTNGTAGNSNGSLPS